MTAKSKASAVSSKTASHTRPSWSISLKTGSSENKSAVVDVLVCVRCSCRWFRGLRPLKVSHLLSLRRAVFSWISCHLNRLDHHRVLLETAAEVSRQLQTVYSCATTSLEWITSHYSSRFVFLVLKKIGNNNRHLWFAYRPDLSRLISHVPVRG